MEIISFFDINDAYIGEDGQYTSIYYELANAAPELASLSIYSNYGEIIGDKLVKIMDNKWKAVSLEKRSTIYKPFYFHYENDRKLLADLFENKVDIEGVYMTIVAGVTRHRAKASLVNVRPIAGQMVIIGLIIGLVAFIGACWD
jgi:hypothetical protein